MTTTTIQCRCGAIKLELTGEPVAQFYCHCDDCQAVHGAAYLPAVVYMRTSTRLIAGEPVTWKLKTTARATCAQCGTRMFADPAQGDARGIPALLLPQGMFKPTFHAHCQHTLLPIQDSLPHFKGFPAAFGGSDEQVPW